MVFVVFALDVDFAVVLAVEAEAVDGDLPVLERRRRVDRRRLISYTPFGENQDALRIANTRILLHQQ